MQNPSTRKNTKRFFKRNTSSTVRKAASKKVKTNYSSSAARRNITNYDNSKGMFSPALTGSNNNQSAKQQTPRVKIDSSLLKIGEAAKVLGVSIDTLRRWEKAGKIETERTPGGTRLYSLESLRKINPISVEIHQTISTQPNPLSTEELLKKSELVSPSKAWERIEPVTSVIPGRSETTTPESDSGRAPSSLARMTIINKFLLGSAFCLILTLILTSGIVAAYFTSPKTTQQFFKGNVASGILSPFHFLAEETIAVIDPKKAEGLGFASQSHLPGGAEPPPIAHLEGELNNYSAVLAVTSTSPFLEVNSNTQISGSLFVRDLINNLSLEATPSAGTMAFVSGDTTLTVTNNALLDQDVSTTSTPSFNTLNLTATSNQITFGTGGILTWTPAAARTITLPDVTTTLVGIDNTQTLTNKSMSGSSNTFTNIPNSALSNNKVTVSAGTNLSGGGDVSLGASVSLALKDSPAISGVLSLADGTAAAPALTFSNDTNSGLYRIGADKIGLITGGSATKGLTIDASGNVGVGTISPIFQLETTGNAGIGASLTVTSAGYFGSLETSSLSASGNIGIGASLNVTSASTLDSLSVTKSISGATLGISGTSNLAGVFTSGNVGIGATTSRNKLDVWGNARVTGNLVVDGTMTNSAAQFLAADGSAGAPSYSFTNLTDAGLWTNGDGLLLTTGGSNTSGITVTGAGNIGIGTTSPDYTFRVNGTGLFTGFVGIGSSLNVSGNVGIGASINTVSAGIFGSLGASSLSISGDSTLGTLTTSGNVGIGGSASITGLTYTLGGLRVNGYSDLTGNVGIGSSLNVTSVGLFGGLGTSSLSVSGNTTLGTLYTTGNVGLGASANVVSILTAGSIDTSTLSVSGNTTLGTLTTVGNVGIGASADIVSNLNAGSISTSTLSVSGAGYLETLTTTGNVGIGASINVTSAGIFGSLGTSALSVSGNTTLNTLTTGGNAGIGQSLTVTSASTLDSLSVTKSISGATLGISGDSNLATVYTSGNVGIGATSTAYNLDVWGTGRITSNLTVGGTLTVNGNITGPDTGTVGYISRTTNPVSLIYPTTITDTIGTYGNIGIGTTDPDYNLKVMGTGYFSNFVGIGSSLNVAGNVGIGQSLTVISATTLDSLTVTKSISAATLGTTGNVGIGASINVTSAGIFGSLGTSALSVSGNTTLNTLTTGGNVGIGGSASITGLTYALGGLRVNGYSDLTGNVGIGSSLNVTSAALLDSLSVTKSISGATLGISGNVGIGGSADIVSNLNAGSISTSTLSVSGAGYLQTLTTTGNVGIGASINVTSAGIFGSLGTSALSVSGNTTLNTLTTGGNVGIGGSASITGLTYALGGLRVNGYSDLTGNVGIGSSLNVTSVGLFGGLGTSSLSVSGNTTLGTLYTTGNVGLGASASVVSILTAGSIDTSTLSVSGNSTLGTLTTVGNVGIGASINVTSAGIFGSLGTSALSVSGNTTLSTLTVSGNTGIGSSLTVTSASILDSLSVTKSISGATLGISGNSNLATVYTSGNMGIGTTSTAYNLDVWGTGRITGALTTGGTITPGGQFLALDGAVGAPSYSFASDTDTGIYRPSADAMSLSTNGASVMTLTQAKLVGIGTTAPAALLQITDSASPEEYNVAGSLPSHTKLYITGGLTESDLSIDGIYGRIFIGADKNKNYGTYIGTRRDASANFYQVLGIKNNGTSVDAMTINANGNVGIGTTDPRAKLEIYNNAAASANGSEVLRLQANYLGDTAGSGGYLSFYSGNTESGRIRSFNESSNVIGLDFSTYNSGLNQSVMRITGVGNVGIGTTTANSLLSVAGGAHIGSLRQGISAPTDGLFVDGNVGIGATTSSNKLDVWGNARVTGTFTADSTTMLANALTVTSAGSVGIGITAPVATFQVNSSGTSAFVINSSGNVGIGFTSPIQKFQVGSGSQVLSFDSNLGSLGLGTVTPGVVVSDSFNRTDSATTLGTATSGQSWSALAGTWGTSSNTAYHVSGSGYQSTAEAVIDSGLSDATIQVTIPTVSSNFAGIVFRATDSANFLTFYYDGGPDQYYFAKMEGGGTITTLNTVAVAEANGDVIKVVLSGSSVKIYLNDTLRVDTTNTFNQTATKHGFMADHFDTTVRFEDFSVSKLNNLHVSGSGNIDINTAATIGLNIRGASSQTGNLFQLQSNGYSNLAFFNSNGNLGIGVSGAGSSLTVAGNGTIGWGTASVSGPINGLGISGNLGVGTTSPNNKLQVIGGGVFGNDYAQYSAPSSGLLVQGNVGIGSTGSVNYNLDVWGTGRITEALTVGGNIGVGASINTTSAGIFGSLGTSTLSVSGNSTLGTLTTVGNVGIGASINVTSAGIFGSLGTSALSVSGNTTLNTLTTAGNTGIGQSLTVTSATTLDSLSVTKSISGATLGISGDSNLATVYTSGNVGIGATTSSNKLDVWGDAVITGNLTLGGNVLPNLDDVSDLGSNTARFKDLYLGPGSLHVGTSTSDEYTLEYDTANNRLGFNANGSGPAEVIINSTGNVGIGTTDATTPLDIKTGNTSGTLLNVSYKSTATLTGALIGIKTDLNDGYVTPTNQDVTGLRVVLPTTTNTNAEGTVTLSGMSLGFGDGVGINQNGAGATVYNGASLTLPALTQTQGTLTANGVLVTTPSSITTGGTANGFNISATGIGAGNLNGVNIGIITGGSGTETGINIGTGWDAALKVGGTTVINGSGVTQVAGGGTGIASYNIGDILYASAEGVLTNLGIGTSGQILTTTNGIPVWANVNGSSCVNCLTNNPTSTQTLSPTGQSTTGLSIRQTSTAEPSQDIFNVTSSDGNTKYFYVDKDGNVSTGGVASTTLTLTPGSNTTALTLVGTNVTTADLAYFNAKNTEGTIFDIAYGSNQTLTGTLTGQAINFTNLGIGASNQSVTGTAITMPGVTNTNAEGTKTYTGLSVTSSSGINQNGAGATTLNGVSVTIPAITQTQGTLTANGVLVTTPSSITTGGTANGVNITATGVGSGTLYGLNISTITPGAGTEYGINIGTGWDYGLYSQTTNPSYFAGNLGIGATTSSNKLDVWGDARISGSLTVDGNFTLGGSNTGAQFLANDGTASAPGYSFTNDTDSGLYRLTTNKIGLVAGGSTSQGLTLDGNGNVGIGTTNPEAKLNVYSPTVSDTLLKVNNNASTGWVFANQGVTNNRVGLFGYDGSTLRIKFDPEPGSVSYFNAGNVGIGATTVNSKLSVVGNAHIGSIRQGISAPTDGLFVDGNVGIGATTSSNKLDVWGNSRIGGTLTVDGNTSLSSTLTTLSSTNFVGIGTTSPLSQLHVVSGNVGISSSQGFGSEQVLNGTKWAGDFDEQADVDAWSGFSTTKTLSSGRIRSTNASDGGYIEKTVTTEVGKQYYYTITFSDGNVNTHIRLGTTSAGTQYAECDHCGPQTLAGTITATSTTLYINLKTDSTIDAKWTEYDNISVREIGIAPSYALQIAGNMSRDLFKVGDYALTIPYTGNIGIGISAPDRLLQVASTIDITSSMASLMGPGGTQFNISGATTNAAKKLAIGIDTTNNYGVLQAGNVDGTAYNLSLQPGGGNVGIGTTSPTALLNLRSDTIPQLIVQGATADSGQLHFSGGNSASIIQFWDASDSGTSRASAIGANVPGGALSSNTANLYLSTYNSGTWGARMTVTNAGNVGIGATTVNSKLSVIGNAHIGSVRQGISAPTDGLFVDGNVGIGTTTSSNKLDVWGNSRISGTLTVDSTTLLANNFVVTPQGFIGIGITNPQTTLQVGSVPNPALYTSLGNVGIGTTGLSSRLSIGGNVSITDTSDTDGTGADGACSVTDGTVTLDAGSSNTCAGRGTADSVNYNIATSLSSGSTTINVGATPTGIATGDEILVINLRGTSTDYANVGKYETHYVTSVSGNFLTLDSPLVNTYDGTTQKIMVQRIPQYTTVTVGDSTGAAASAVLTTSAYNNTNGEGGVIFFRATGAVTINSDGKVDGAGKGYAGAAAKRAGGTTYNGTGGNGASLSGNAGTSGQGGGGGGLNSDGGAGTTGGAGGGGGQNSLGGNPSGGGGGGGYGTVGSYGSGAGNGQSGSGSSGGNGGTSASISGGGGGGGGTYGTSDLSSLFFGSGGGAGADGTAAMPTGGNGGGIIFISSSAITVSGTITANGNNGEAGDGGGAGGAGGSVYIKAAATTLGSSLVTAAGGTGYCCQSYAGGNGGSGRIRLDYTSSSGVTSPGAGYTGSISPSLFINRSSSIGDILGLQYAGTDKFRIDSSGNILSAAGSIWQPLVDSTHSLGIGNSASQVFVSFDTQNSRVGIGTTGPGAMLSVSGNGVFGFGGATSISGPSNGLGISGNLGIGTTSPNNKLQVIGAGVFGADYAQYSAPSNGLLVQGNVGIGSTGSVNYNLDVWGTGRITGALTTGGTITPGGQFLALDGTVSAPSYSFASDTDTGIYRPSTNAMSLSTNGANVMTLTQAGNVGIGVTNPAGLLDVNGKLTVLSDGNVGVGTIGPGAKLDIQGSNTLLNVGSTTTTLSAVAEINGSSTDLTTLRLRNTNWAADQINTLLFSHGYLEANTDGGAIKSHLNAGGATSELQFWTDTGGLAQALTIDGSGYIYLGTDTNTYWSHPADDSFAWTTGGTERLRVNSSGNTGIGTSSPNSLLSVAGNAHIGSIRQGISAPTDGLFVDGNVGIGTTTSSNKLDVWGNSRISGTLTVDSTGTLGSGLIGYSGVTAPTSGLAVSGNIGIGTTSTLAPLHIWGNNTNAALFLNGNVGIGFTTANSKLDVTGNVTITPTAAGADGLQLTNGTSKVLGLRYGASDVTLDVFSPEPENLLTNGTFESDLTSWNDGNTARTVTFQPEATDGTDTWIYTGAGTYNYGTSTTMTVHGHPAYVSRPLIQFTLTSIPSTATVTSSVMTLYVDSVYAASNSTIPARRSLTQWFEGAKDNAAPDAGQNGSTWNLRNANGSLAWGTAGGQSDVDYASSATATATVGAADTYPTWNLTTDVANMVTGAVSNYGWWLTDVNVDRSKNFATSDYATASKRPKLVTTYTVPATATRNTSTTYGGSAASTKIAAGDAFTNFTQSANVGDTDSYNLVAYAYTDGSAVTSSDVELYYNNATITTTYTAVGGGWYRLTGSITGANENREYGVQVKANKTVYVDNISLQSGIGSTKTLYMANTGTGILHLSMGGQTTINTKVASEKGLVIQGVTSQVGNLTEWQNSSGSILSVIDANGNLGIGTSQPQAKLSIQGNVGIGYTGVNQSIPVNGLAVLGNIGIGTTTANSSLSVSGNAHIGSIRQGISAPTDGLFVDGNVGIGATTSSNKLDVWGNARIAGTLAIDSTSTFGGNLTLTGNLLPSIDDTFDLGSDSARWANVYVGPSTLHIGTSTSDEYTLAYDTTNNRLGFNVNGSGPAEIVMDSNGNLGIGTTSPVAPLNTLGDATIGSYADVSALFESNDWNNQVFMRTSSTSNNIASAMYGILDSANSVVLSMGGAYDSGLSGNDRHKYGLQSAGQLTFSVNGANQNSPSMTILSSGNVGIGATTVNSKLSVAGNAHIGSIRQGISAPTDGLFVDGNVGIGATTSSNKLDVWGNSRIAGTLTLDSTITSLGGMFGYAPGTALSAGTDLAVSGNVGIGTTSPTTPFYLTNTATTGTIATIAANSLSSGTALSISSVSNSFSSGYLTNLDWSPTTATTATGSLLNIGIGASGMGANFLNLSDAGSSVFSISKTSLTTSLPTSFTAAGDVSMAYDLNMSNPTASYIKSNAPLYLQAGKIYNSSDLTLRTFNSGQVVLDASGGVTLNQYQPWTLASSTMAWNIVDASNNTLMTFDTTNQRVGIGKTGPYAKFQITGAGTSTGLSFLTTDSSGTQRFAILDNGNVGIGTTSPGMFTGYVPSNGKFLSVSGSGAGVLELARPLDTDDNGVGVIQFINENNADGTNVDADSKMIAAIVGRIETTDSNAQDDSGGHLTFVTKPEAGSLTERMRITSDGNVGIGDASPLALLTVGDGDLFRVNSSGYALLPDGAASTPSLSFTGDTNTGMYRLGDDILRLTTAGSATAGITINSVGNVGIGTTAPGVKLDVVGDINALGGTNLLIGVGDDSNNLGQLQWNSTGDFAKLVTRQASTWYDNTLVLNAGNVGIGTTSPLALTHIYQTGAADAFRVDDAAADTSYFVIDQAGNVGVGTNSFLDASTKLQVAGQIVTSGSVAGLQLVDRDSSGNWAIYHNEGNLNFYDTDNRVTIATGGNVGIGTTTVNSKLSVVGNAHIGSVRQGISAPTDGLFVDGNVGIGATTSSNKLDVWGNSRIAGTLTLDSTITSLGGMFGYAPGTALSAGTDLAVSGNLGIGTTSPTTPFYLTNTATTGTIATIAANSLSSGTALSISSVSNSFSSGYLTNLDWSPTTATTATGSLLNIGIGASGMGANFLNLSDAGSSVFSISKTSLTTSLPVSFNSPGDVSVAYDLNMTNPTASYIKSQAPLYLQAGEVFNSSDLTLQTFNSGNINFDPGPGGSVKVGIGSTAPFIVNGQAVIGKGNVDLNLTAPLNGLLVQGNVGIGTSAAGAALQASGAGLFGWGTASVAAPANGLAVFGNVGIGTTSPLSKLSVIGGGVFGNNYGTLTAPADGLLVQGLVGIGTTAPGNTLAVAGGLNLGTYASATGPTNGLAISGNVGIGTTSPLAPLQVWGNNTNSAFFLNGNVGIGTTSPGTAKLQVRGSLADATGNNVLQIEGNGEPAFTITSASATSNYNAVQILSRSRGTIDSPSVVQSGDTIFEWWGQGYDGDSWVGLAQIKFEVDADPGDGDMPGRITFGTTGDGGATPQTRLTIENDGDVKVANLAGVGNRAVYSDANGVLTNSASDIGLKTNIETISNQIDVLDALAQLRGVYFNWRQDIPESERFGTQKEIGMIAQEVEQILPELVGTNSNGYKSLNYAQLSGFLIEVGKAQQGLIDNLQIQQTSSSVVIAANSEAVSALQSKTINHELLTVNQNGNTGIGTTNPQFTLEINGTGKLNDSSWTYASDARLKENVASISTGMDIINALNPVTYDYISGGKNRSGFIAQEVQTVLPGLVSTDPSTGMLGVRTDEILPYAVKAIQEQQNQLSAISLQLSDLQNTLSISADGTINIPALKAGTITLDPNIAYTTHLPGEDQTTDSTHLEGEASVNIATKIASLEERLAALESVIASNNLSLRTAGEAISTTEIATGSSTLRNDDNVAGEATSSASVIPNDSEESLANASTSETRSSNELRDSSLITQNDNNATDSASIATDSAQIATDSAITSNTSEVDTSSLDLTSEVSDDLELTDPSVLLATSSASLIINQKSLIVSEATVSGKLTAYDLDIQNGLKSLGQTTLGNTLVAGDFTIDGTMSITGNSINSIGSSPSSGVGLDSPEVNGILYLQNGPLSQGLDILNGQFTFTADGTLTVSGTVLASEFAVKQGTTAGTGTILAGQLDTIIENEYVDENSVILITPHTPLTQTLAVTDKVKGGFLIQLAHTESQNITFDYLIVGVK